MADRIERERSGAMGIVGVIIGALIVIAVAFFLIGGWDWRGGGTTTTINTPAPSAPSTAAPAAPAPRPGGAAGSGGSGGAAGGR